jgi:2-(1,2-epoxy-1,2-dihydrophenyl)acetyl-CoA isomerase
MADLGYQTILYDVVDGVATLTLHRPERRNTMSNEMVLEVGDVLQKAAADASIRLLVLTGSGSSFCPGADINAVASGSTVSERRIGPEDFQVPAVIHDMAAVTVAAINGACAGAGLGWAAACDLRIATRSAKFNSAFLDVGVAGDMSSPWSLTRLLGAAKARELFFIPDKFDADEARRIGFVARVFDDDDYAAGVDAVIARLAAASPPALRTMKQNFLDAERLSLSEFATVEAERHMQLFTLADTREAFAARVEKRAPRFTGH